MKRYRCQWDAPDDPNGNVQHIADHGLNIDDVEETLKNAVGEGTSASSSRPCFWGYTPAGDYVIVIYEELDADTIRVVTAYEVPEPG